MAVFLEAKTGEDIDEKALSNKIETLISRSQNQTRRINEIKIVWDAKYPKPINCQLLSKKNYNYTVFYGDTLNSIALRGYTTVEVLLKLNPEIRYRDNIKAGQTIKVPNYITPDPFGSVFKPKPIHKRPIKG